MCTAFQKKKTHFTRGHVITSPALDVKRHLLRVKSLAVHTHRVPNIKFHSLHIRKPTPTISLPEGQHPLTGQRAANFRPLANQWSERRLVTQWRHGCRAMRRSVCNAADASNAGRSLWVQISRERSYPCQYIDTARKAIDCATTLPPTLFI